MSVNVRKSLAETLQFDQEQIDLERHELLTLAQAARIVPGKPGGLHVATLWRWATHGVRGRILPNVFIGGIRYTSREALFAFLASSTPAGAVKLTSKQRERQIDAAEAELAAMGVR